MFLKKKKQEKTLYRKDSLTPYAYFSINYMHVYKIISNFHKNPCLLDPATPWLLACRQDRLPNNLPNVRAYLNTSTPIADGQTGS